MANSEQLKVLKQHFPNCFDKNGAFIPDKLQAIVEENGVKVATEGYSLNWLGKSYASFLMNEAPRTLLKADAVHNAHPDNLSSQNLLIKGDNLEVLKHLKGAYSRQVKMIYIDPPYNTGSDGFVYADDRQFTAEQLSHLAKISEEEASRVLDFTNSKSNSHSAWLTFMYPRLYIARELLRDDGVIFISIDYNELSQLKILCDEVFGEESFIEIFSWARTSTPAGLDAKSRKTNEYVLCYEKTRNQIKYNGALLDGKDQPLLNRGNNNRSLVFPPKSILFNSEAFSDGKHSPQTSERVSILEEFEIVNAFNSTPVTLSGEFKWQQSFLNTEILNKTSFIIKSKKLSIRFIRAEEGYKRPNNHIQDKYLSPLVNKSDNGVGTNETGSAELLALMSESVFDNPKPTSLIRYFISFFEDDDFIVLDFFAGSGTTAHAVMQLNAADGGNRQFICVQLPEATPAKSEARKAGYSTIFDITHARITKAAAKIKTEYPAYQGDLGFKVFETVPVFEGYLDEPEELSVNLEMFNSDTLTEQDRFNLLLTWAVQDGISLTSELTPVELAGYIAYQGGEAGRLLYFIHPKLSLDVVVELLRRLDDDAKFAPKHLVVWGYGLESKEQREMSEAIAHHNKSNRKGIELDLEVRF